MTNSDELLAIVNRILSHVEEDETALKHWRETEDGQKVIQFIFQFAKYHTNISEGEGISIGDKLDIEVVKEIRDLLRSQLAISMPTIDWYKVSRELLREQRLTTNPLTIGEGIAYRTEQVYVPLGLVRREKKTRRGEDILPEEGSSLYRETKGKTYKLKEFLEEVLWQGQSANSQGRRIAIIGEPGAGKTTLLQQIAQGILQKTNEAVVIWISLADLRGQELKSYLFETWLTSIVEKFGQAKASTQVENAFVAQFNQGRVWLLLDGADEMQVASGDPLSEIERQVRASELLREARIVLTCRLNLWDSNRNALDRFDAYRMLEFSYPCEVEQFIKQWFKSLPEPQVEQGQQLCAVIKEPGKARIRDLIKNPLRLTLLCFNWYLGEGKLPETKAGLYEQFVADFYEWKKGQFSTTAEQRKRLNAALGELAREAIDKEATRFRLRQEFVCEYLGEPDDADSLFGLALRLGWLNKVGVEAENPRKGVYGFFHPTFQEYFAAKDFCDRANWEGLFSHIGEKHWREIFLLAVGIAPRGSKLLQFMKIQTDKLLFEDQELQKFLAWIVEKVQSSRLCGDLAPYTRIAYFGLFSDQTVYLDFLIKIINIQLLDHLIAIIYYLGDDESDILGDDESDIKYIEAAFHGLEIIDKLDKTMGYTIILDLIFYCILQSINYQHLWSIKILFEKLIAKDIYPTLEARRSILKLENDLPYIQSEEESKKWWDKKGEKWNQKIKTIINKYYNIEQNWEFSETQKQLIKQYCYNNLLLIDCFQECINNKEVEKLRNNYFQ